MFTCASVSVPSLANEPEPPLSKDFLTYLAELVEVDGKWVHPTELANKEAKPSAGSNAENQTKQKEALDSNSINKENTKTADNQEEDN